MHALGFHFFGSCRQYWTWFLEICCHETTFIPWRSSFKKKVVTFNKKNSIKDFTDSQASNVASVDITITWSDKFGQLKDWLVDTDSGFNTLLAIPVQHGQRYSTNSNAYQKVLKNCIKSNLIGAPIKTNAIEVLEELKMIARLTTESLKRTCICCVKQVGVNEIYQHGICETKSVREWKMQNRQTTSNTQQPETINAQTDDEVPLTVRRRRTSGVTQDSMRMEEAAAILTSITDMPMEDVPVRPLQPVPPSPSPKVKKKKRRERTFLTTKEKFLLMDLKIIIRRILFQFVLTRRVFKVLHQKQRYHGSQQWCGGREIRKLYTSQVLNILQQSIPKLWNW